jgi:hypothetical protein
VAGAAAAPPSVNPVAAGAALAAGVPNRLVAGAWLVPPAAPPKLKPPAAAGAWPVPKLKPGVAGAADAGGFAAPVWVTRGSSRSSRHMRWVGRGQAQADDGAEMTREPTCRTSVEVEACRQQLSVSRCACCVAKYDAGLPTPTEACHGAYNAAGYVKC